MNNKFIKIINAIGDEFGLDVATFGKQGLAEDNLIINVRFHNYSDGTQIQVDNVGNGTMFVLRQACWLCVGNGTFFQFQRAEDDGTGAMKSTEYLLNITNDADFLWLKQRTVLMTTTKTDDNTPAFRLQP